MLRRCFTVLLLSAALVACGTARAPSAGDAAGWHAVTIPGKRVTSYTAESKDGRAAIRAVADASASLWRRKVDMPGESLTDVRWSWWVDGPVPTADLMDAERSDSPVRLVLAFDGDRSKLSQRTRLMFELARTLTGEEPPYATLMYVWSADLPTETIVKSHRTDRIRKIVVDGGAASLRRWRDHRRNVAADFERVFGEPPGRLVGVAWLTDADNTGTRAKAWYGAVELTR